MRISSSKFNLYSDAFASIILLLFIIYSLLFDKIFILGLGAIISFIYTAYRSCRNEIIVNDSYIEVSSIFRKKRIYLITDFNSFKKTLPPGVLKIIFCNGDSYSFFPQLKNKNVLFDFSSVDEFIQKYSILIKN